MNYATMFHLIRPMLFALPPEDAHKLTLKSLERGLHPKPLLPDAECLSVNAFGLQFSNPLAIAAGFDKDAQVSDAVIAMGCGFAEVGTTTPKPQPGNPRPRVFRLLEDRGLINRLGFNNAGHAAALENLSQRCRTEPLCINIGANKDSEDRIKDYVTGLTTFYDLASLFMINISSPNTPGLRDLQAPETLDALVSALMEAREAQCATGKPSRPLVVKLAPDIAEDDLAPIVERLTTLNVDGIALSNTTLARPGLRSMHAKEAGGLSGKPVFHRATVILARVYQLTHGKIPLIGIGGIDSGQTALAKIEAGATLLELYTGLIYRGPGLISEIKQHLTQACRSRGAASLSEIVGRGSETWAKKSLEAEV